MGNLLGLSVATLHRDAMRTEKQMRVSTSKILSDNGYRRSTLAVWRLNELQGEEVEGVRARGHEEAKWQKVRNGGPENTC